MFPLAALWLAVLAQDNEPPPPPTAAPPAPVAQPPVQPAPATQIGGTRFHGAFELSALSFPSGPPPGGQQDLYAVLTPLIGVDGGGDFSFELGAELKLLLLGPSVDRNQDYGHILRLQDWNEASDFGQILRDVRVGADGSAFQLRGGPLEGYTLGWGHLINRYVERLNPDYHPSGARLIAFLGPMRDEVMVSDLLGARIFAGEVALDLGRIFSSSPDDADRFHLAGSALYDFGRAGTQVGALPLGLADIDVDGAIYRGSVVRVFLELGSGARVDIKANSLSAEAGVSVDAQLDGPRLSGKVELRKQQGNFRPSMVGPGYELARFADVGLGADPIRAVNLPDGFSGYMEVAGAMGSDAPGESSASASFSAEHYSWGRTDADASLSVRLFSGHLVATGRGIAVDAFGARPRYSATADLRFRVAASFYMLAYAGTVHTPLASGGLSAGFYAGVGLAADFTR